MFKKDRLATGIILGLVFPLLGLLLFKMIKLKELSVKEAFQYMLYQPGHGLLTVALSLSLLLNALVFTLFINNGRDNIAKGLFISTVLFGVAILIMKTVY